ncbi:MAG: hypothetical protein ABEL76_04970, partial [Bradymonadaceae bacterium]
MSSHPFVERAESAAEQGEYGRAVLTFAEGLKRHPDVDDAAVRMTELYLEHAETPGLEESLVEALVAARNGDAHLRRIRRELRDQHRVQLARHVDEALETMGVELAPVESPEQRDQGPAGGSTNRPGEPRDQSGASEGAAVGPAGESPGSEPSPVSTPVPDELGGGSDRVGSNQGATDRPEDDAGRGSPTGGGPESADLDGTGDREPETVESEPAIESEGAGSQERSRPNRGAAPYAWAVAAVLVTGAVIWWWLWPMYLASRADAAVARLQIGRSGRVVERLETLGSGAGGPYDGRSAFAASFGALHGGSSLDRRPSADDVWSRAAIANAALASGDVERALRESIRFRRLRAESIPALWTRARVAEARGRYERASDIYARGHREFPAFAPFLAGRGRVALASLDVEAFERAVGRLSEGDGS